MHKKLISICIIGILLFGIYKYVQNKETSLIASHEADIEDIVERSSESAEPIYIIQPQFTQDNTYEMQGWQVAYAEYIESVEYAPYNKYALIYVDEDDIPELIINTNTYATACTVLTFHDGEVDALQTWSLQCNYIEKKNLYWDAGGQMGEFYDQVYTIENGKWVHVAGGQYIAQELLIEEYDFAWEGKSVSEDEYYENLHAVYDIEKNQNVGAEQYERLDEMLFRLKTEITETENTEKENGEATDTVDAETESKWPYIQLLAEGDEELSESERAEFLAAFGFRDSESFYVHAEEDGYPFMELYFDEEREIGCGIRYGKYDFGNVICGFAFDSCQEVSWHARDPFSVLSVYGTTGESMVTDYQENYEYDKEGRLIGFQSTGTPTDIDREDFKNIPMIEVGFTYDDQGKLREKEYRHFSTPHLPFGTTYSYQISYYDESERLSHTASYITHGSLEGYYIYPDDSDVPAYYLELDHQYTSRPTLYKFVNRVHNWQFDSFGRSTETQLQDDKGDHSYEAAFLAEQGFTGDDLFYEYAWTSGSEYRLSLYCDKYVTRGVGFIRIYIDGEYLETEMFTFDGCEEYLNDAAVGQYSVYSDYDINGREIHFLEGEAIDDYFGAMELEGIYAVSFDYEDGQLVHMEQGLTHGGADRFYFYRSGDYSYRCGPYMLEVDHGWGITLYKF